MAKDKDTEKRNYCSSCNKEIGHGVKLCGKCRLQWEQLLGHRK